jgi:hypothetical protein
MASVVRALDPERSERLGRFYDTVGTANLFGATATKASR